MLRRYRKYGGRVWGSRRSRRSNLSVISIPLSTPSSSRAGGGRPPRLSRGPEGPELPRDARGPALQGGGRVVRQTPVVPVQPHRGRDRRVGLAPSPQNLL